MKQFSILYRKACNTVDEHEVQHVYCESMLRVKSINDHCSNNDARAHRMRQAFAATAVVTQGRRKVHEMELDCLTA